MHLYIKYNLMSINYRYWINLNTCNFSNWYNSYCFFHMLGTQYHILNISFNKYISLKYINLQNNYMRNFNIYFLSLNTINLSKLYNSYYSIHMLNNFNHIFDNSFNLGNILYYNNSYKFQEFRYNNIVHHILNNHYNLNLNTDCNLQNIINNYLFRLNNNLINNFCNKYYYLNKMSNFYRTTYINFNIHSIPEYKFQYKYLVFV